MLELGDAEFDERLDRLASRFSGLGDLSVRLTKAEGELRRVSFRIDAPGIALPTLARFDYLEWYRRWAHRWQLAKYRYDFHDLRRGGWAGFHLHDLWGRPRVAHLHCVRPDGSLADRHFYHYQVDILAAHADLERLYAAVEPIRCGGLFELRPETA